MHLKRQKIYTNQCRYWWYWAKKMRICENSWRSHANTHLSICKRPRQIDLSRLSFIEGSYDICASVFPMAVASTEDCYFGFYLLAKASSHTFNLLFLSIISTCNSCVSCYRSANSYLEMELTFLCVRLARKGLYLYFIYVGLSNLEDGELVSLIFSSFRFVGFSRFFIYGFKYYKKGSFMDG